MLSKAAFLIQASPFVFFVIVLCGCGGSETVPAGGEQASPEPAEGVATRAASGAEDPAGKSPAAARKEAGSELPARGDGTGGATAPVQEKRLGGIAAIVGNKVISRPRLRKKVDRRILAIMAQQQVTPAAINRRLHERLILTDMVNRELILQAQLAVYPGKELEDLVTVNNVMAFVDREIGKRRKAGQTEVVTREDYFDAQKSELGIERDEAILGIREKMLSEMFLWEAVYSKLDRFISPSQSRAYYRSHPEEFTTPLEVSYQRIKIFDSVSCLGKIKGVQEGLQAGRPFGELAQTYSEEFQGNPKLRATVFKNKYIELDDFSFPIPVILKRLREGQHSGPDRAQGAFWFFRMNSIIKGEPKTYKEAQTEIENRLLIDRRKVAYDQLVERLRADTRVEIYLSSQAATSPAAGSPSGGGLGGQEEAKKELQARP